MNPSPLVCALAAAALVGCGGASTTSTAASGVAPAPATGRPSIGVPCQLSAAPGGDSVPNAEPIRVFVEVAAVRGDVAQVLRGAPGPASKGGTFADLLRDPRLEMPNVQHVVLKNDAPETVAWDTERPKGPGGCAERDRWDLTLTAHADSERPASVRLDVSLAPAPPLGTPPESWQIPEHRRIQTTVVVKDQQTVVLGGVAEPGATSSSRSILLMTPYVLREQSDLKRLFECKQRQAS